MASGGAGRALSRRGEILPRDWRAAPSLSLRPRVFCLRTRACVRLLGPCFKTGRVRCRPGRGRSRRPKNQICQNERDGSRRGLARSQPRSSRTATPTRTDLSFRRERTDRFLGPGHGHRTQGYITGEIPPLPPPTTLGAAQTDPHAAHVHGSAPEKPSKPLRDPESVDPEPQTGGSDPLS